MSIVKVTLPGGEVPVMGKQVSFVAPCPCNVTDGLEIGGEHYTVVDSLCQCVTGVGGRWDVGAIVSVILDTDKKYAFLQNDNAVRSVNGKTGAVTLSAADVGAAPAGYGLGENTTFIPNDKLLSAYLGNGFYNWGSGNTDPNKPFATGSLVPITVNSGYVIQHAFATGGATYYHCVRKITDGVVGEWEWDNPYLTENIQYRTTQRIGDKAVYLKNVSGIIQYRLDGETTWKPYVTAVGGVAIDGSSYMTGNLNIQKASPVVRLIDNTEEADAQVYCAADRLYLQVRNAYNDANRRHLFLGNSNVKTIGQALQLVDVVDSKTATYDILHTGNVTAGTTDITAGETALANGAQYLVYE